MPDFSEHIWRNHRTGNPEQLPLSYPHFPNDVRIERPQIFDPALKHYDRAFRSGEPEFRDEELRLRWRESRRYAMDCVLKLVSESPVREHLVLRGSVAMRAWFGLAAREPGDIDWVVVPRSVGPDDLVATRLMDGLANLIATSVPPEGIQFGHEVALDDIWTYERARGRRMVFVWQAEGLPPGHVQMDFVFGERLWTPPQDVEIPLLSGGSALVQAASQELSLAWKLVWLETDMYPQGKDLYDATLLAQQTPLRLDILKSALEAADWRREQLTADFPLRWDVDWESFSREHPWIEGTAKDWQRRLAQALRPTFADAASTE
jgi:hypothetical protein